MIILPFYDGQSRDMRKINNKLLIKSKYGSCEYYSKTLLSPQIIIKHACLKKTIQDALELTEKLDPDNYTRFLEDYYKAGLENLGDDWDYADIVTVLLVVSNLIKPNNYLEIGVRRGRSLAAVVVHSPDVNIYAFDMWMDNYGKNPNPGPEFVQREMKKFSYSKHIKFINGNSHETLPKFFQENPNIEFDLITVDGDHSYEGALQDLRDVLPHLTIGGVIVFDDICHPRLPHLISAWKKAIEEDRGVMTDEYVMLGYGVAVGVRHWEPGAPNVLELDKTLKKDRPLKKIISKLKSLLST